MQALLAKTGGNSIYKLVITAAKRALELGAGSGKLVDADPNAKLTTIALKEIMQNKVSYKIVKT